MALHFTTAQVASIGTAATLIHAATGNRTRLTVRNTGAADMQIGAAAVTWGTGHIVKAGESYDVRSGDAVYGITQSTTTSASTFEETE